MPIIRKPNGDRADRNWPALASIAVKGLFGKYDFPETEFPVGQGAKSDIAIFYGDNGAGKTTILRLVYGLLSKKTGAGNRGTLARIPFRAFSVRLRNGDLVRVAKEDGLVGNFKISVYRAGKVTDYVFGCEPDYRVTFDKSPGAYGYLEYLASLSLDLLFLQDDRTIKTTYSFFEERSAEWHLTSSRELARRRLISELEWRRLHEPSPLTDAGASRSDPEQIINATFAWLRTKTIKETSTGEENAFNVYVNVVRALSRGRGREDASTGGVEDLLLELDKLEAKTPDFSKYNLLPSYSFKIFHDALSRLSKSRRMESKIFERRNSTIRIVFCLIETNFFRRPYS